MTDRTTVTYPHQQTPPPQSHPVPPPPWMPPPPARRRSRLWWLLLIPASAVVLLCGVLAIGLAAGSDSPAAEADGTQAGEADGMSRDAAQRACRTAVGTEWEGRQKAVTDDPDKTSVVISTQGVDLLETWQTGDGWSVNATVRFTVTSWPADPIVDTLDLTCAASGQDDAPVTAVANR